MAREVVDLDALFEKYLSWTEAGDADCVTKKALLATRFGVAAARHEVPISKKRYVKLLRSFAGEMLSKRSECEAKTQQSDARVAGWRSWS